MPDQVRKIIHVDMDAFFASVEQRDDPSLRGRPVAVGGGAERGVVAAASYEARAFGVRSAMPSVTARRRCPDLVFVRPRFAVYKAVSAEIRAVFAAFTPLIEPLSLDEAYLDVTGHAWPATRIAGDIRARILAETGLTASAGVSCNKFLAKLASDHRKPDGLTVVRPGEGEAFVAALPVERFHGIGPRTAERLHAMGVRTGADLRAVPLEDLERRFGQAGAWYHGLARGLDERPVRVDRVRKSLGHETTFDHDLGPDELGAGVAPLVESVWAHAAGGAPARTVTLKVKYSDFRQITRRRTLPAPLRERADLDAAVHALVSELRPERGVRLLGVTLSNYTAADTEPPRQLGLAL